MDVLFEAQFSQLADSGRALSKCGKCLRYMKYISTRPPRLYCNTCEEVYHLPQNGTIKVNPSSFHVNCLVEHGYIKWALGWSSLCELLFWAVVYCHDMDSV